MSDFDLDEEDELDPYEDEQRQADDIASIDLENYDGPTWTTAGLMHDFEVIGYASPFVVVRRKADQLVGTLEYLSRPRVYFGFTPYNEAA